jgi:hypothetical protein
MVNLQAGTIRERSRVLAAREPSRVSGGRFAPFRSVQLASSGFIVPLCQ